MASDQLSNAARTRRPPRIAYSSDEDESSSSNDQERPNAARPIDVASSSDESGDASSLYHSCTEKLVSEIIDLTLSSDDDEQVSFKKPAKIRAPRRISSNSSSGDAEDADSPPTPFMAYSPPPKSARKPLAIVQNEALKPPISPSKLRIPQSPLREEDASFWDAEMHHAWIDRHQTASPLKRQALPSSPCKSPSKQESAALSRAKRQFFVDRESLATNFLARFLQRMCSTSDENAMHTLADPIRIDWSKTLNTTAGRATYRKSSHTAFIELSAKVIDCRERLEATLAHELCHLLTWIVSQDFKQPHGKAFKAHAARVERKMGIHVSTKHDYEIDYKYQWSCLNIDCGRIFGRHSKSIDVAKVCCGVCKARLVQIKPTPRVPTVSVPGAPNRVNEGLNRYKAFLRDHLEAVKQAHPGLKHAELIKIVAAQYQASKADTLASTLSDLGALSLH